MSNAISGLFLRQQGKDFDFIRFYDDGEVYFASFRSASSRQKVIDSVREWFQRGIKARNRSEYQYDGRVLRWDFVNDRKRFDVRGELDGFGRLATIWRDRKTELESLRLYAPLGEAGESLPVYINVASLDELAALPGVSRAVAARIVERREQSGDFAAVEDLLKLKGFGKKGLGLCAHLCDARPSEAKGMLASVPTVEVTQQLLGVALKERLGPRVDADASPFRSFGGYELVYEVVLSWPTPLTVASWGRGDAGFETRARNFDDEVLLAVLDAVRDYPREELAGLDTVRVLPIDSKRFDRVALVPGRLGGYHEPPLKECVHTLYPIMSWEVADGISVDSLKYLQSSNVGLKLADWQRSLLPMMQFRVISPASNLGYRVTKKPYLVNPEKVVNPLVKRFHSGEVEFWDVRGRHVVLRGRASTIEIEHDGTVESIEHRLLQQALDRFLKGGSIRGARS